MKEDKYERSSADIQNEWDTQHELLRIHCEQFDAGNEIIAKSISTVIRVLFHESKYSNSLRKQAKLHHYLVLSSGDLYTPSNLVSSWTLLAMTLSEEGIRFVPIERSKRNFLLDFEDWWNEVIFEDNPKYQGNL